MQNTKKHDSPSQRNSVENHVELKQKKNMIPTCPKNETATQSASTDVLGHKWLYKFEVSRGISTGSLLDP